MLLNYMHDTAHSDAYSVFSHFRDFTQTNKLKSQLNFGLLTLRGQSEGAASLPTGTNTLQEHFCSVGEISRLLSHLKVQMHINSFM